MNESTGRLKVETPPAWQLVATAEARSRRATAPAPAAASSPRSTSSSRDSRATSSSSTRRAARWSSAPATRTPRTASRTSTTSSRTARPRCPALVEMFHERHAPRRASRGRGHHLRDGQRRRRHGHRHGRRDRHRDPQPRPDHRRVRQPGVHEHGRAAELLDAARPPHLDEQRRPRRARQVLPPQGHAADHGGDEHPLRLHRRRGLPGRPAREGRQGPVVREARGHGVREAAHLLPAELADDRPRRHRHRPGGRRLLLLPALRDRAALHVAHLRPGAARAAHSRRRVARD